LKKRDSAFLIGCVLIHLALGILLFPGAGTDDCFITYQAVDRLSDTGRIENLNGQSVEISSSLSHVLVLAILKVPLPWSTFWIGLVVSVLCGAVVIVSTWWISMLVFDLSEVAKTATLGAALHGPLLYWSWSGMETTFSAVWFTVLVGLAIRFVRCAKVANKMAWRSSFVVAGISVFLARPEGFVIVGVTLSFMLVFSVMMSKFDRMKTIHAWGPTIGAVGVIAIAVTMWRWLTFERLLPNPVYAKTSGITIEKIVRGATYAFESITTPPMLVLFALPILAVVFAWIHRHVPGRGQGGAMSRAGSWWNDHPIWDGPLTLVGACIATYGATVVAAGGDWMPHGRFTIHILPLMLCLGSGAIWRVLRSFSPRERRFSVGLVLVLVVTVSVADSTWVSPVRERRCLWNLDIRPEEPFTVAFQRLNAGNRRDTELLLPVLRPAARRIIEEKGSVCLLTGQMGMIPYALYQEFGDQVQFIDRRGLTEADLTRFNDLPRHQWGLGIGFEDVAEGVIATDRQDDMGRAVRHIWDREPDIVYGLWFRPSRFGETARVFAERGFRVTQFTAVRSIFPERETFGEHVFMLEAGIPSPPP